MAIPISKAYDLTIITNNDSSNSKRVLKLGTNQFIDYKTQDYANVLFMCLTL